MWKPISVPSRGAIFLNLKHRTLRPLQTSFPSPLGELYFLMSVNKKAIEKAIDKFPSPLGELYFLIPSLRPRLFSGGICRFAWQIVFSGNIAFFGMNFCRFSQCLCGAWETPAKFPDFCFFDSFGFYDSFGCNVISHCPIMYSFP